jgi:hypothetical protein
VHALVAMAAMGVANFLLQGRRGGGGLPATFIAGQALVFTPLATTFAWKVDGAIRPPRRLALRRDDGGALPLALVMLFESLRSAK